ncbi:MAG: SURF1 family protein, partial [Betaproteobacteria bacterium]|nr:SURF1 family protein [Betaproteobacteria bacterium]
MDSSSNAQGQYAPVPVSTASQSSGSRCRVALFGGLLLAMLLPAFISLGMWQWNKAEAKQVLQAEFDRRGLAPPVPLPADSPAADSLRYRHVILRGTYDADHQVLIDNRLKQGVAGYHVLTPLHLADGDRYVLINRGWLPAPANHHEQPAAPVPAGDIELTGIAVLPPERFFNLAEQPVSGWEPVWQNLDLERFRGLVPGRLLGIVIQLDPQAPAGFDREWPRPDERIERHRSYALQWFGFAIAS